MLIEMLIEVRIHGRGGQGSVSAAHLLATAAFHGGLHGQSFPSFGAERRGAPVAAFVRIANRQLTQRNQVSHPDFLIVQDAHLLTQVKNLTSGLKPTGGILVNARPDWTHPPDLPRLVTLPATDLAREILGKPIPNTALLAAFVALTGLVPLESLLQALGNRFTGDLLARNQRLIEQAATLVPAGSWQEVANV